MNNPVPHFFLGLPIPKDTAEKVSSIVAKEKDHLSFKTWVVPEDYHITLHFLGAASNEQLDQIKHGLPDLVKRFSSFELEMTHMGTFGEPLSPRILWVGVKKESSLFSLQEGVGATCKQAGFEIEKRPYSPHITIARRWIGKDRFSLGPLSLGSNFKWRVEEVLLYQSHMNRLPKYEAVDRFSLA